MNSILSLIKLSGKNGRLLLENGSKHASILISKNHFLSATSPEDLLFGEYLIQEGYLRIEDLSKALELHKKLGLPVGKIVQGMGFLGSDESTLPRLLNRYLREVIFRVMKWTDGHFSFEETSPSVVAGSNSAVRLHIDFVMLDTNQRLDLWRELAGNVNSLRSALRINRHAISDSSSLLLTYDQLQIMSYVNGRRTLVRILEKIGHDEMHYLGVINDMLKRRWLIEKEAEAMRLIIPTRVAALQSSRERQFPGKFSANLLYKEIDGKRNLLTLGQRLNFELNEVWENLTLLVKSQIVEIAEGRREFHNLSEEM